MIRRRLFAAFFFVAALLLGQQAAAWHDVVHATDVHHVCGDCFLAGQLTGGADAHVATPPIVLHGAIDALPLRESPAPAVTRVCFLSRAPPIAS